MRLKISSLKDKLLLLSENDKFKEFIEKIHQKSENTGNIDLLRSLVLIMEHMQEDDFISKNEPFMFQFNLHMIEPIYNNLIRHNFMHSQISYEKAVKLSLDTFKELRVVIYPRFKEALDNFKQEKEEFLDSLNLIYDQSLAIKEEKEALLRVNPFDQNAIASLRNAIYNLSSKLQSYKDMIKTLASGLYGYINEVIIKKEDVKKISSLLKKFHTYYFT